MEASSPLAAIHRPMPAPSWGLREQLAKGTSDYFAKEVRGSSPAASLAADLSQNFHIDNESSPKFPTPRRALFTANMMGGIGGRNFLSTPPLVSSSPAPLTEIMEMSPLPHKAPFSALLEITSPSPSTSASEDTMIRKFAAPRRPCASRLKGLLASSMAKGFQSDPSLPSFPFGNESASSSTLSLDECFESGSPPQDRSRPSSANSPCPSIPLIRQRPQFAGVGASSRHGSPSNFHSRRQSNPFLRTRKQFRRSLSMFENPADIMKSKPETQPPSSVLKTVADIEEAHEPILPHFMAEDPTDNIPRITRETMLDILDGKYCDKFDQRMVIDCRFEYEYDGGHIDGAVNHNDKELLASQLFETPMNGMTLLIFHCEYSAHRAPLMARHIRSQDRTINAEHYPRLTYPEVLPPEYVEMSDEKHQRTCEREMGRLKARKGLGRAQTFASFGQRESCVLDSPTGPPRPHSRNNPTYNTISDSPVFDERARTRRLASY
ncbi:M-phase inducer phosphatase [Cladobotryum mycophilum]|uniref:protein-tyrosine-phosphatase n=1 Tax=Cladobotryum mycophilum TaxID=491253 RepID=A0ABR0SEZ3_9HYPO